uniref:Uncharacterized protein n=1 Tax=Panagrolaimus davidi TaxID=227884 RepID=A0A914QBP1_9BILA
MNYFENHLTSDNAPTYMAKTLMNPDLSEFSEKCLKVAPSATGVISVTNFFILDKYDKPKAVFLAEWILQILQQDRPDDYEEILFAKIFEWAKVYCRYHGLQEDSTNIKEAMKDLIPYIRFGNLEYSTLAKIVRPLISVEELLSHFCNKAKEHEKQSNGKVADT